MNEPTLVRRLTTIVSIDVVGFSTMSARNEEHALDLLGARMATAEAIVKHHRGRVFKLTGDGLLAEFVSPVEAVRAALETQEAMRSANATADQDNQLILRIGINLGDVVESGDDLMGDAVNVAVRLESIAPHGGICVSAAIYEQIVGKLTLGAEDMGEQHVKNIPRPIHAYRLTPGGKTPIVTATVPPAVRKAPSRLVAIAGGVAAVAAVAIAGAWLLHEKTEPLPRPVQAAAAPPATQTTPPAAVAATPMPAGTSESTAAPPPPLDPSVTGPRIYDAADVPFVPDFRRRALDNYAEAEGSKAMAINVRGIFAVATRRVDDPTARRIAIEECNGAAADGRECPKQSRRPLHEIQSQAGAGARPRSFRLVVAQRDRSRRHQAQPAGLWPPHRPALRRLFHRRGGVGAYASASQGHQHFHAAGSDQSRHPPAGSARALPGGQRLAGDRARAQWPPGDCLRPLQRERGRERRRRRMRTRRRHRVRHAGGRP